MLLSLDKHKCACYYNTRTSTNVHVTMKVGGDMKNNLKQMRLKMGLTQSQVANKAHLSERGYQYIEAGSRIPNTYLAIKIARTLDTSVEELFPLSST